MNAPIVEAVSQILREKNIDKDVFQEIIEGVFLSMIKKKYGSADNFNVIFNLEKGDIEIFCEKTIVDDDDLTDPVTQIPLSRALTLDPDLDIDDQYAELVPLNDFGRRLVTSARQNLTQKIKEIEKENIYSEFSARVGEVVSGEIHQINRREIRVNLDRHDALLPKNEQIYNEKYVRGKGIRAIIKEVRRTTKEPEIILSRADGMFVRRLFELEVPEIFDNIIEIKGIVREAGDRTKIAVMSHDKRIDPVGACVGMKGVRIQAVVRELNNEKIDIVHWSPDAEIFIKRAMAPVTPLLVMVDEEARSASVVVPDDQIQFAIGRRGQNIRLASQLTGYQIEPIKESEYLAPEELSVAEVVELSDDVKEKLKGAGYESAESVLDAGAEKLREIEGMDEEMVRHTLEVLSTYFEEANDKDSDRSEHSEAENLQEVHAGSEHEHEHESDGRPNAAESEG
ncbi:MAG TPA: transcription termination factor NusA [bacterium]|jgi:N utilization substance protein A